MSRTYRKGGPSGARHAKREGQRKGWLPLEQERVRVTRARALDARIADHMMDYRSLDK